MPLLRRKCIALELLTVKCAALGVSLRQTVGLIHTLEQCLNSMQTVGLIHTLEQCLNRMQTVGLIHTLEQCLNRMQTVGSSTH
ncbi:hypothetical protein AAFF_G00166930 [Aldrovandia affinis]|uniref:Uncharacterized protein n=1 Tax=Aldrovandia affinis TaxID=143900 RepID=A0AAD7W8G3_9TELE|nr:hypothetical protein AAFF_G00166930 [Aldrovandia affinis]